MMFAPRSYLFTRSQSSPSAHRKRSNNETPRSTPNIPTTRQPAEQQQPWSTSLSPQREVPAGMKSLPTETAASEPVVIPQRPRSSRNNPSETKEQRRGEYSSSSRKGSSRSQRRAQDVHSPDAIPPSVAALLALTSIPKPKPGSLRRRRDLAQDDGQRLTVEAMLKHAGLSEKDLGMAMALTTKGPMDVLLSPPDDEIDEDEALRSESGLPESSLPSTTTTTTRTISSESVPSLYSESLDYDAIVGCSSPPSPSPSPASVGGTTPASLRSVGRRRSLPSRRRLESVSGSEASLTDFQAQQQQYHPLSVPEEDDDHDDHDHDKVPGGIGGLDFRAFQRSPITVTATVAGEQAPTSKLDALASSSSSSTSPPSPSPRSVFFASNLTASLRALRSAARTISALRPPLMLPEDYLTRSIITGFDTNSNINNNTNSSGQQAAPFADERRPPLQLLLPLEETPTPALRRYLNPTSNAPIEAHVPRSSARTQVQSRTGSSSSAAAAALRPLGPSKVSASIQMQTYKVSRPARLSSSSSSSSSSSTTAPIIISRRTFVTTASAEEEEKALALAAAAAAAAAAAGGNPVARQRDVRENGDFIRVAVMEMAMRRSGKLDEKMPGRARWCLPPRRPARGPYVIAEGGVPARWVGVSSEEEEED